MLAFLKHDFVALAYVLGLPLAFGGFNEWVFAGPNGIGWALFMAVIWPISVPAFGWAAWQMELWP
jgi:hypothetical protein